MHELAVCQALLDQVADIAARHHGSRVSSITVKVGPLSGVEPHLLKQAFTLARSGGIADRARLVIEPEVVRIHCETCGGEHETGPNRLRCPDCRPGSIRLISGESLLLASVAIERPGPDAPSDTRTGDAYV